MATYTVSMLKTKPTRSPGLPAREIVDHDIWRMSDIDLAVEAKNTFELDGYHVTIKTNGTTIYKSW